MEHQCVEVSDLLELKTRKGTVRLVVVSMRNKRTGGYEVKLGEEADPTRIWTWNPKTTHYPSLTDAKYVGSSDQSNVEKTRQEMYDRENEKEDLKRKDADLIAKLGVKKGDTIGIKGPHYEWTATVAEVGYDKVAVLRNNQEEIRKRQDTAATVRYMIQQYGFTNGHRRGPRGPSEVQHVEGRFITRIVQPTEIKP